MQISQGIRKRQGAGRSQHFLDAFKAFKRDSYEEPVAVVHAALFGAAQNELRGPAAPADGADASAKRGKAAAKHAPGKSESSNQAQGIFSHDLRW